MDVFDPALQESDWLRRLARSLVRDAHEAEDALQETWAAALEHGPGPRRSLRAWLGAILRNEVRQAARARGRREGHERGVGARGDEPGSDDVAARLELQALVLEAVRGLEEPYRGAIVARFFDGLAAREIARRDGLPVKTVNTRLERALGKLRARLDARCGGERRTWLQALAPFAVSGGGIGPWLGEGVAMGAKAKVAAGVVIAVGALWVGREMLAPGERARVVERGAVAGAELERGPAVEPVELDAPVETASDTRSSLDVDRVPAAADAESASATVRPASESATLDVRVRLQGTGLTPNQALVLVTDAAPDAGGAEGVSALFEGRTRPLDQGGTDASGAVRLAVPAGRPLWVSVDPHRWYRRPGAGSKQELVQRTTVPVEPLASGEVRALLVELVHGSDRVFLGQVVAAEDGHALVDASVEPDESFGEPVTSGAKGLFELPYASWDPPGEVRVTAAGYSPRFLRLQWVDQEPGVPYVVALAREATLAVRVAARGRTELELVARARTDRGGEPELRLRLDGAGRGEIAVPAELPLDVELRADEGGRLWGPPEPLTLAAGERRELVLDLGQGTLVYGVLRDGAGTPLGDRELWAVRPEPGDSVAGRTCYSPGEREGAQVVRSLADGRFEFAALASGAWWIGPGRDAVWWQKEEPDATALAPLFVGVELAPGEGARRLDLVAHSGLWIQGRVVGEDGRPVPRSSLRGQAELGEHELLALTDERGEFTLGPLVPGAYSLRVDAAEAGMGWNGDSTTVNAGAKDVVLVYRPGRAIAGRVVDEQGHAVDAHVHLLRPRQGSLGQGTSSVDQGAFVFHSLDEGECFVQAGMPDGRVAVERVELVGNGRVADLVLTVRPGARIGVRHDLERGVRCAIWCDGRLAADSTISPGEVNFETVPCGPIRVELYEGGATLAVRDLTARADRVESLEFDLR